MFGSELNPVDRGPFSAEGEFGPLPDYGIAGPNRREFLKLAGFTLAGTAVAGCRRAPVEHALPRLVQPEDNVPGRSYYYASVCGGCSAGCGLLVKSRDGRPIKLEGNPEHPLSRGGLCAAGQASLLGLYDRHRLREPLRDGAEAQWSDIDQAIRAQLQTVRERRQPVRFLTGSIVSPTTRIFIQRFLSTFTDARHVVHDARPGSAVLDAHLQTHGSRLMPHYDFAKAEVVLGFEADFLGGWLSPVEFTRAYSSGRRLDRPEADARMSYHVHFESRLSLTGSKADQRLAVAPADIGLVISHLCARLAQKAGRSMPEAHLDDPPVSSDFLDHLCDTLWQHRSRSLIVCGIQDTKMQVLINFLNDVLGNYGATIDLMRPSYQLQGDDGEVINLLRELRDGHVAALFIQGTNPVHDLPGGDGLADVLKRVPLLACCSERLDETAKLARFVCPVPHYLESWSDAEAVNGVVSLSQPVIAPLGNTRPLLETLNVWTATASGGRTSSAYDLLRTTWEAEVFPRYLRAPGVSEGSAAGDAGALVAATAPSGQGAVPAVAAARPQQRRHDAASFEAFWNQTVHDGVARVAARPVHVQAFKQSAVQLVPRSTHPPQGTFSAVLYSKVSLPDASHAYNPWLHELPDPISKVTWDNYACLSPAAAARLGVSDGDVVRLETEGEGGGSVSLELPAFVQPGQHDQVVSIALGYGSRLSERFAQIGPPWLEARPSVGNDGLVGRNASSLLTWADGNLRFGREGVRLSKTGRQHPLASTQSYHHISPPVQLVQGGKVPLPAVRQTTLAEIRQPSNRTSLNVLPDSSAHHESAGATDLWPNDHPATGARWGMVIDHNACTGCSACVIACQAENNIPVVGKDEVRRHREMHWLRIDRYYIDHGESQIDVVHQPMLCQHCGNAPCEAVCPVLATVHSSEGLNQQVYNRCVGTRYCANNCPYKVRRFNWFDYAHEDTLENLSLNPDVTVRSRGVMEKCTFCVQRIQEAKSEAGREGRPLRDNEIQTACQQSCPAQAIVFGNLNNPASKVSQFGKNPRTYHVLEELNVRPSVSYLTLVRNRTGNTQGDAHG